MDRIVALCTALACISVCHTSTSSEMVGTVVADDGRIGIGLITGGHFGPGSFSIGTPGSSRPAKNPVYDNEEDGDGEYVHLQRPTHNGGQRDDYRPPQRGSTSEPNNSGGSRGNARMNPANPERTHTSSGQRGEGGQGGRGGGQIVIGAVVLPNHKSNKENKKKHSNRKQPVSTDATALEATFAGNEANNGFPSAEYASGIKGSQDSILIGSITGGNFKDGVWSLNNNNERPTEPNVPKKGSTLNHGNTGYPNAGNEAVYTIGHGASNNGDADGGAGYDSGYNPYGNDERWIWR